MAPNRGTVRNVLDEIHEMRDWIPLTGAPGANDYNANCAGREEVLELVECIFSDSRVYTGTIEPGVGDDGIFRRRVRMLTASTARRRSPEPGS